MRIRWAKKAIRPKADALERQILRLFKNRRPRHRRFAKIAAILALGSVVWPLDGIWNGVGRARWLPVLRKLGVFFTVSHSVAVLIFVP